MTYERGTPEWDEWRRKVSEGHKGIRPSEESRQKMRAAKIGKKMAPETVVKLKASLAERNKDPELRHKYGSGKRGKTLSEETKRKISESEKGKHVSDETRRKLSESKKGKPQTKPRTEEHCRKLSEAQSGEKGHNWLGGKSFEKYCPKFNNGFKRRVRTFFDYRCVECGKEIKKNAYVHHVSYDKDVCCNNKKPYFVILCQSCHSKTNFNREYWEEHFTQLIETKYNGQCYVSKEDLE